MFINWKLRELNIKIVYYGPALSGKTTNLGIIHKRSNPWLRSEPVSLKTRTDRTIFFDYLQLELGQIKGLKPRINLYTVPGQEMYKASRKLVLRGADGVVFVADSQMACLADNIQSFKTMLLHLQQLGLHPYQTPCVVQFNKQDLPNLVPLPVLQRLFVRSGTPWFMSAACEGHGVFETLKAMINLVVSRAQQQRH